MGQLSGLDKLNTQLSLALFWGTELIDQSQHNSKDYNAQNYHIVGFHDVKYYDIIISEISGCIIIISDGLRWGNWILVII